MCNCKAERENLIQKRFIEQNPNAINHDVKLVGYAFTLDKSLTMHPYMYVEMSADFPLKKGGLKRKTKKTKLMLNFCPFCGEELSQGGAA